MSMRIGDTVRLRDDAVHGARGELAGEPGKVGDVREVLGERCCTVVYEAFNCLIWDAPVSDFEPVVLPKPAVH